METSIRINLTTTDQPSAAIPIAAFNRAAASIDPSAWGSAVVELKWSARIGLDEDGTSLEDWESFSTAVTFSSSTPSRDVIAIGPAGYLRFEVTTADGSADDNAYAHVSMR